MTMDLLTFVPYISRADNLYEWHDQYAVLLVGLHNDHRTSSYEISLCRAFWPQTQPFRKACSRFNTSRVEVV
jgi:hypothetical protein